MNNYQETTISGTSYVRGREVTVINQLGGYKGIMFAEERVSVFGETVMRENIGAIHQELTTENAATEFQLLNPVTNEPIGATASFQDVYAILFSLYYHLAAQRDAANQDQGEIT